MSIFSRLFGGSAPAPEPADDPDDTILQSLRDAGIDLTAARPLDFFLYFHGEREASSALEEAKREGYSGDLHPPPDADGDWLAILHRPMIPSRNTIKAARARLEALAEEHEGEFEGWDDAESH